MRLGIAIMVTERSESRPCDGKFCSIPTIRFFFEFFFFFRHQFDQLARLREIYTSQLAMAEVVPAFRINDACSVFSEPAYRFIAGPGK